MITEIQTIAGGLKMSPLEETTLKKFNCEKKHLHRVISSAPDHWATRHFSSIHLNTILSAPYIVIVACWASINIFWDSTAVLQPKFQLPYSTLQTDH